MGQNVTRPADPIWPNGARTVALFTFDVDPNVYAPNFHDVVVPRVLDILRDYDIKATFFWPGMMAEAYPKLVERCVNEGHEIGHHGWAHERLVTYSLEESLALVEKGLESIRKVTDAPIRGFRSPAGDMGPDIFSILADHGFLYDSILGDDDVPYLLEGGKLVELPFHWSVDDAMQFGGLRPPMLSDYTRPLGSPNYVYNVWRTEFDGCYQLGRLFNLICHPHVIGRPSRILTLERLIQHVKGHPDVICMRCDELAIYWLAGAEQG